MYKKIKDVTILIRAMELSTQRFPLIKRHSIFLLSMIR